MKKNKAKRTIAFDLFGDADKDGVKNVVDCAPFDKTKHGFFGDVYSRVKQSSPIHFVGGQVSGFRKTFGGRQPPVSPVRPPEVTGGYVPVSPGFVPKPTPYAPTYTPEEPYIIQKPPTPPPPGFISGQITGFQEIFTEKGRAQVLARERETRYDQLAVQMSKQNASLSKYEKMVDADNMFTGTEAEYNAYSAVYNKQNRDVTEYNEIAIAINKKIAGQETKRKAQFFGVRGKAEEVYGKGKEWIMPRVSGLLPDPAGIADVKARFYKPYSEMSPEEKAIIAKMDPLTRYLVGSEHMHKFKTTVSEPMFGYYKQVYEDPAKEAALLATMAVFPGVTKGAGWISKIAGIPHAVSKVPVVGRPFARYGARAAGYGLLGFWGGTEAYKLYQTAPEKRLEQAGRLGVDLTAIYLGGRIGARTYPYLQRGVARVGEFTGVVRAKTYGFKDIPYMSRAEQVEMILERKYITGVTGAPTGKIPTTTYMTIGRPKLFEPYGKYFTGKEEQGAFKVIYSKIIKKGGIPKDLRNIFKKEGFPLSPTARIKSIRKDPGAWLVKSRGRDYIIRQHKGDLIVNLRVEPYELGAAYVQTGRTVRLSPSLKTQIYGSIRTKGEFEKLYPEIERIALAQSKALGGERIFIPSPKRATGFGEPESEAVWIAFGKPKITGKEFIGYAGEGIPTYALKYGKELPIKGFKPFENIMYNIQKGSKYQESMAKDMERRLGELYGTKLSYKGAYEPGLHGKTHVQDVERRMLLLRDKFPELRSLTNKEIHLIAKYHDMAKIYSGETQPIKHAKAAATAIRQGRLKDPLLEGLSTKEREGIARAIELHTKVKPSIIHKVVYHPTPAAKALANADRMALERMGMKVDPTKLFKFKTPTLPSKRKVALGIAMDTMIIGKGRPKISEPFFKIKTKPPKVKGKKPVTKKYYYVTKKGKRYYYPISTKKMDYYLIPKITTPKYVYYKEFGKKEPPYAPYVKKPEPYKPYVIEPEHYKPYVPYVEKPEPYVPYPKLPELYVPYVPPYTPRPPPKIIKRIIPPPPPTRPKKKKKLTKAQLRKARQTAILNPIKTPLEVLKWRM